MMNVITGSSHSNQLSVVTSYPGISDYHSNKMVITTSAMKELYGDLNFQQIRFHCSKQVDARSTWSRLLTALGKPWSSTLAV